MAGLNGNFRSAVGQIALSLHIAEGVQTSMTQSVMMCCLQGPAFWIAQEQLPPGNIERGGTSSMILVSLIPHANFESDLSTYLSSGGSTCS